MKLKEYSFRTFDILVAWVWGSSKASLLDYYVIIIVIIKIFFEKLKLLKSFDPLSELKVSIKHWRWLNIDQIVTVKIPIYIFDRKPGELCV